MSLIPDYKWKRCWPVDLRLGDYIRASANGVTVEGKVQRIEGAKITLGDNMPARFFIFTPGWVIEKGML